MAGRALHVGLGLCLALGCWALLAGGCGKDLAKPQTASAPAPPIEKTAERGPVRMVVRANPSRISIADRMQLSIQVDAASNVDIEMPSFGEKLNEFEIMDFRDRSAVPQADARRWTQEYTLETFLSGQQEIPAMTVKFNDRRDPSKPVQGELATDPFSIEVTSLLSGEVDPTQFRDIKGAVELPRDRRYWWAWAIGGAVVLIALAVAGLYWLRRRSMRAAIPRQLAPHEWAYFAFERLEEDQLVERHLVQEFYFRLSGIVREYIERRFGIMAPEQTTGEFLTELRRNNALRNDHKHLLGDFLEAADLVKFARYEPAGGEVQDALGTARAFVDQTVPMPEVMEEKKAGKMPAPQGGETGKMPTSQGVVSLGKEEQR